MNIGPKSKIKRWRLEPRRMVNEGGPILTTDLKLEFVNQALEEHCRTGKPADTIMYFMMTKPDFPTHSSYDSRVMIAAVVGSQKDYAAEYERQQRQMERMSARVDIYG